MVETFGNFEFDFHEEIEGLVVITPKVFSDNRGSFKETFNSEAFKKAGLPFEFKQFNRSQSKKGVIRGIHLQSPHHQGKLVSVTKGKVLDVAWDLRSDSKTFGSYFCIILDAEQNKQFYIPAGFGHGFLALEDCEFDYKCTDVYYPNEEITVLYDSSTIPWLYYAREYGIPHFIASQKDISRAITFEQYRMMYYGQDC